MRHPFFIAALLGLACASAPALADIHDQRYNQVALRAEVSSEVAHDRMHVTLYSEAQHSDHAARDVFCRGTA